MTRYPILPAAPRRHEHCNRWGELPAAFPPTLNSCIAASNENNRNGIQPKCIQKQGSQ